MAWDCYGFDSQNNESIPLAGRFITPNLTRDFTPCYVTHDCEAHLLGSTMASEFTAARGFDQIKYLGSIVGTVTRKPVIYGSSARPNPRCYHS